MGSIVLFLSLSTFAQADIEDNDADASVEKRIHDGGTIDEPLPVEAGVGGDLKLQRKYRTKLINKFEWHTHLLWESRYVTEGRDNLSGESLVSISSEFMIDDINFVPWFAYSPGVDYSELNLNFVYGTLLAEDLPAYFGYNHIRARYKDERAIDNEISFDVAYKLINHVGLFTSIYHSFDANGSFIELGAKYFDALSKKIHYGVQASLGANAEYVPDGHNGLNHVQLRTNASYHPVEQIELYAYAGYNQSIRRNALQYAGDELLGDFFWGGIGLTYLF